jgi:hypothetical protein
MSTSAWTEDRHRGWYVLIAVGIVTFVLALLPGTAALLPAGAVAERLGNDYFLLGTFGAVALAVVAWTLSRRAKGTVSQAAPPEPETVLDAPQPGAGLDGFAEGLPVSIVRGGDDADAVRERLRRVAVTEETRRRDFSDETARERVEAGAWTEDPVAATFLATDQTAKPGMNERVRLAFRGDSWAQVCARVTMRALVEQAETSGRGRAAG